MNRYLQQLFSVSNWVLPLLLLVCLITPISSVGAGTTVTNSVHVTADTGSNHATVTTIINGEVVEDWSASSTEPIVYSKSIYSSSTINNNKTVSSTTPSQTTYQNQLQKLINQLQALISLYVSLLNY